MARKDAMEAVEYELAEGRAYALGLAGKRVEAAIAALEAHERDREVLLDEAADAVWRYLIVRESAGFHDHREAMKLYRVSPQVMARVGVVRRR
jgi:hypothetical protein